MGAFNFKRRFADAVRSGAKTSTIRAARRDGRDPEPGDRLVLYVNQRSKNARVLRDTVCSLRRSIEISAEGKVVMSGTGELNEGQREILAIADGFESWDELVAFFREVHGLPFSGFWYCWPK